MEHYSVMLQECLDALEIKEDKIYVDATFGAGGHSSAILKKLTTGKLISFDQDVNAYKYVDEMKDENFIFVNDNFKNLKVRLSELGIDKIDGIIFDLGISSMQIDNPERGFSYMQDGPIDMRMNQSAPLTGMDVVNTYSEKELVHIFRKYGEEKLSLQIARGIVAKRPISTTKELTETIIESIPMKFRFGHGHPAKRVYQAIRIEVNKELDVFEEALVDAFDILNIDGTIAVLTFHSLEDRICSYYFKQWARVDENFKNLPVIPEEYLEKAKITVKGIKANEVEMEENSRSKSARLRAIRRVR